MNTDFESAKSVYWYEGGQNHTFVSLTILFIHHFELSVNPTFQVPQNTETWKHPNQTKQKPHIPKKQRSQIIPLLVTIAWCLK